MEKKIKIGIPRAFLYYRYYILWKTFFEGIGLSVILSPFTNKEIINRGKYFAVDESCLPLKIYLGHIDYLASKCDYILVPRVCNYGKKKRVCMRFNGIYDVVNNIFDDTNFLTYDIDNIRFKFEIFGFIKMGLKFSKNIFKILYFYFLGKAKQKKNDIALLNSQEKVLKSNKLKVLIVAHPYVVYDNYLKNNIIDFFKENNIDLLYADRLDRKESILYAKDFSDTLYWQYSKEIIGSIFYYKEAINGIIFLSTFPCGPDSLVNELAIRSLKDIPRINIILDESSADSGLNTRLESFLDIIKKRDNNE